MITRRLARNAGPNARHCAATRLRNFLSAFQAMGLALTRRHARTGPHDPIHDGIVDLILHRTVASPTICHCRYPTSFASQQLQIGNGGGRSKDCQVHRHSSGTRIAANPSVSGPGIDHELWRNT
jgi:hypothetical protein